jgi:hypothetical protein
MDFAPDTPDLAVYREVSKSVLGFEWPSIKGASESLAFCLADYTRRVKEAVNWPRSGPTPKSPSKHLLMNQPSLTSAGRPNLDRALKTAAMGAEEMAMQEPIKHP